MCTGSDTPSSTHLKRPMANWSCGVSRCSTSSCAPWPVEVEHVVGVGADEAEREVEVAEDLRRVDRHVALGVDGGAEVLQAERGPRVVRAGGRGERREHEGRARSAKGRMQTRTTRPREVFTRRRYCDGALELLERVVLDARGRRGLVRGRRGLVRRRRRRRVRRQRVRLRRVRRLVRARVRGCLMRRLRALTAARPARSLGGAPGGTGIGRRRARRVAGGASAAPARSRRARSARPASPRAPRSRSPRPHPPRQPCRR